jgi:enamine deaminase RidA (YjgF/YER057c/UK114 family)
MALQRFETNSRMSQMVIHNETIYLAGQVGDPSGDIAEQTRSMLDKVEKLLVEAGSDKNKILQATIWVANMGDFAKMNEVWDSWVPEGHAPGRACCEARLATPEYKVEIIIIAAK